MGDAIYDMNIAELKEWFDKWIADKRSQTMPGNLNEHPYLISVVRDLVQDNNATMQVLKGVLHRLDTLKPTPVKKEKL